MLERRFELVEIAMRVNHCLGPRQAAAVNDARMVERVAEDHVTFPGQESRRSVDVTQSIADGTTLEVFLKDMESRYLREALRQAGGSQAVAAGLIGITPKDLRDRMERTDLE